jgi:hypothetical protein
VKQGVVVLVRGLRARREEIEEAVFVHVRDVVPSLVGRRDAEYVADLRAAVVAAVDYALAGIERGPVEAGPGLAVGSGEALPAILGNPNARRARECLLFLADHPDSSNREIAIGIGVTHQSQISKLLSCLLRESLVAKRSEGVGRRNEWRLTRHGEAMSRALPERGEQCPESEVR